MQVGDIVRVGDLPKGSRAKTLKIGVVYQIADDIDQDALRRRVYAVKPDNTLSTAAVMIESRGMLKLESLTSHKAEIPVEDEDSELALEDQLEAALDQAESAEAELEKVKAESNAHLKALFKSERTLHKARELLKVAVRDESYDKHCATEDHSEGCTCGKNEWFKAWSDFVSEE